jgi:hypothetical protein
MSRRRRVRGGELSNPYDDGVPQPRRVYGSRKLMPAELEAARLLLGGSV